MSFTESRPLLLRPMLAACDHLRTGLRLLVLIVVLVVPGAGATAMYTVVRGHQIAFSSAERDGAEVVKPLLTALTALAAGTAPDLDSVRSALAAYPGLGLRMPA